MQAHKALESSVSQCQKSERFMVAKKNIRVGKRLRDISLVIPAQKL